MTNLTLKPDSVWDYHKCFRLCYQAKTKLEEALVTIAEYNEANPGSDEIISRLLEEAALIVLTARPKQLELESEIIAPFEPLEPEDDDAIDYQEFGFRNERFAT
ncbi:MAG: hypothetical protein DSM106950_24155 [Stigonema ocellatum SAG 48.90 = DSM 106950]|nr:hypothetical protein [Stigonema ocellatum SAG 48.90 = DSM 106950]